MQAVRGVSGALQRVGQVDREQDLRQLALAVGAHAAVAVLQHHVVEGEGRRYYPRRELAGPLLGFVAPDGEGKDGLEFALNEDLKGRVDKLSGLRDRSGRLLLSDGIEDEQALAGHNVYLTIDQGIQYTAERELMQSARASFMTLK